MREGTCGIWYDNDMSMTFLTDHQNGGFRLAFMYKTQEQMISELLANKIIETEKWPRKIL